MLATGNSATPTQVANALIGNSTNNVFTVCEAANIRLAFAGQLAPLVTVGNRAGVVADFDRCLDNAGKKPGNGTLSTMQALPSSFEALQENSLTTNVKPEAEIPIFNAQQENTDLNALLENPNVKALLENPDLNAMLENPDVNVLLQNPNIKALLESPEVNALLADPNVKAQIENSIVNAQQQEESNVNAQLENPTISALTGVTP